MPRIRRPKSFAITNSCSNNQLTTINNTKTQPLFSTAFTTQQQQEQQQIQRISQLVDNKINTALEQVSNNASATVTNTTQQQYTTSRISNLPTAHTIIQPQLMQDYELIKTQQSSLVVPTLTPRQQAELFFMSNDYKDADRLIQPITWNLQDKQNVKTLSDSNSMDNLLINMISHDNDIAVQYELHTISNTTDDIHRSKIQAMREQAEKMLNNMIQQETQKATLSLYVVQPITIEQLLDKPSEQLTLDEELYELLQPDEVSDLDLLYILRPIEPILTIDIVKKVGLPYHCYYYIDINNPDNVEQEMNNLQFKNAVKPPVDPIIQHMERYVFISIE